jgi:mannose-6-phosphate isomerase-like protein (cupin superfamily)
MFMGKTIGSENMANLKCELLSLQSRESVEGCYGGSEVVLHLLSGKGLLVIGPSDGEHWRYPLDAYDTVWVPADTEFSLTNDGIGNLELSYYRYAV